MSSPQSPFSIIAAVHTPTGGIGIKGRLPWHIPADLAFFAETTRGAVVIMGRRTWESLPPHCRPLRGRINLVLTRQEADHHLAGATTAPSLEAALQLAADKWPSHPIFVIGGEQVYREAIVHPACTTLHITKVMRLPTSTTAAATALSFDAFFPQLPDIFDADADASPSPRFICTEKKAACQYADWLYCFTRYERAPPAPLAPVVTPEV